MVSLRQVECSIKDLRTKQPLKVYETYYEDGIVDCYCLVPDDETDISITLESTGYIAPGLAMLVYIDGVYQTNRNSCGLTLPANGESMDCGQVKFEVYQKECLTSENFILGSSWTLYPLSQRSTDSMGVRDESFSATRNFSTVEVVVLRCGRDAFRDPFGGFGPAPSSDMLQVVPGKGHWQYSRLGDLHVGKHKSEDGSASISVSIKDGNHMDHLPAGTQPSVSEMPALQAFSPGSSSSFVETSRATIAVVQQFQQACPHLSITEIEDMFAGMGINNSDNNTPGSPQPNPRSVNSSPSTFPEATIGIKKHLAKVYDVANNEKSKPEHSHVVLGRPPQIYYHTTAVPDYLDTIEQPYAKFTFHYRNRDTLEACTGEPLDTSLEDAQVKYASKSKEEIIAEYVSYQKYIDANNQSNSVNVQVNSTDTTQAADPRNSGGSPSWNDDKKDESSYGPPPVQKETQNAANNQETLAATTYSNNDKNDAANNAWDNSNKDTSDTDKNQVTNNSWGNSISPGLNQGQDNSGGAWPSLSTVAEPDNIKTPATNTPWGGETQSSTKAIANASFSSKADNSMHQNFLSNIFPTQTIFAYMVQITAPQDGTTATSNGESAPTEGNGSQAPQLSTPRRRARAESFYTNRSAAGILDDTNEQPGYGAIDSYERLIMQRAQRTQCLRTRAFAENPPSTPPSTSHAAPYKPLPPNPHLEPFPPFNQAAIDERSAARAPALSFPRTPSPSRSPVRGRTMRRRSDTLAQENQGSPVYSPFSRTPRRLTSSRSPSGSATPRPLTRVPFRATSSPSRLLQNGSVKKDADKVDTEE